MSGRAEHGKIRKTFMRRIVPMKNKMQKGAVMFLTGAPALQR